MLENMLVQEFMTHPAITVSSKTSLRQAQQIMRDYQIRHLPVVDGHQLVGILSSGDIRRASPSSATTLSVWELRALWEKVTVAEVMSKQLVTIAATTSVHEAVRLMYDNRFNSLPVVDKANQLMGIFTEVDLYRLLLETPKTSGIGGFAQQENEYLLAATL